MLKKKTSNIVLDTAQLSWKKRPSEIRGYQRAFYLNSEDGDYIRVDYNLKEKRVRLYMEIEGEGGNAYYSVITNGKISTERSVSTGRNFGFSDKFRERADVFSTLPNREVLKLVNRNYGIQRGRAAAKEEPKNEKEKLIQETKERYFKNEFYDQAGPGEEEGRTMLSRIRLVDILDVGFGLLLCGCVFIFFNYSYTAMGACAAFFGIIVGFVDMFLRGRSPIITKILLFLSGGTISYIYGYFF
jgi:hypothetical protein